MWFFDVFGLTCVDYCWFICDYLWVLIWLLCLLLLDLGSGLFVVLWFVLFDLTCVLTF